MSQTLRRGLGLSAIFIVPVLLLAWQDGGFEPASIWALVLAVPFGVGIAFAGELVRGLLARALGPKR